MSAVSRLRDQLEMFRDCAARPGMYEEGERALADLALIEAVVNAAVPLVDGREMRQVEWNVVMSQLRYVVTRAAEA